MTDFYGKYANTIYHVVATPKGTIVTCVTMTSIKTEACYLNKSVIQVSNSLRLVPCSDTAYAEAYAEVARLLCKY